MEPGKQEAAETQEPMGAAARAQQVSAVQEEEVQDQVSLDLPIWNQDQVSANLPIRKWEQVSVGRQLGTMNRCQLAGCTCCKGAGC